MVTLQPYNRHLKKTFVLAYPVMLSQLGHIMVGVVDSIMVGKLGPTPLAASSFANNFMAVFLMFGIGVSYGITPLVAQSDGRGEETKIARLLRHGIVLCLVLGLSLWGLLSALSITFPLLGQPQDVIALGKPYFFIIASSLVPLMLFQSFRQFAEGLSITKPTMFISMAANLLNILLNYLLIFGHWGFPALGLNGAGWATLISRVLMAYSLYLFMKHYPRLKVYREGFQWMKIKSQFFKPMLKIGIPSGIQFIFEVGAFAMAAIMMGWLGTIPLAAHQIAISLVSVSYMMASGISAASTVRVGNHLGRGDLWNMRRAGNTSFLMAILFMTFCSLTYMLFKNFFPTLYVTDVEVIEIAASLILVAGFFQLSDGIQVVGLGCLRGMSDVKKPTLITLMAYWGLAIPASYLLGFVFNMGPVGIWLGLLIGLSVAAITLWLRFNQLCRHKLRNAPIT